jgi:serine/threonine-protein kinase
LVDGVPEEFGVNAAFLLSQILGSDQGIAVHSSPVFLNAHGPDASLREISNSFRLNLVVQGTICHVDGSLKATVNLTDTASQTITWSDCFECAIADFGFVRRIAEAIASRFAHVEPGPLRHLIIPDNAIAADHYCRGVRSWAERTPRSVSEAEGHFRLAAAADPKHAATYAGLANCALFRAILGQRPSDLAPVAIEMAARAVGCDPDSADAHAVLGAVRSIFQHDWPAAEAEYMVAAQLNPDSVDLLGWYSGHLAVLGRADEAMHTARRLEVLDAHSPFITAHVAKVLYFCGEYEAASSRFESIIAFAPQMDMAHGFLGMALCAGGDIAQGICHLERAADLTGRADGYLGPLGHYLAKSGKALRAQEIAQELESRSAVHYVPATQIAIVWAGLGQIDKVFRCLNQAVEDNDFFLSLLKIWPPFQAVRDDPRFVAILRRLGL